MNSILTHLGSLLTLAVVATAAQSAPYFGTWTLQPAKSDLGPVQITFTEKDAGQFIWTDDLSKRTYTFGTDGKGYTDPYGMTTRWTKQGPRAWRVSYTANGKEVGVETYTLSADGKSLTSHATVATMKGTQEVAMTRIGGGDGLAGTWRGKLQVPAFEMDIQPNGTEGVFYRVRGSFEVKAMFDGQPYPMTGPLVAHPATAAFTRTGPRSFRTLQKEGAKTTLDASATVSDDGKALTMTGVDEAGTKRTWEFTREK